jgi:hypothetical protein
VIAAVMQPYFFPYIGYFQLMSQCDTFVVFDDVQYVDHRWMNRNRILLNGKSAWLTYPVERGPLAGSIRDRLYVARDQDRLDVLNKLHEAYRRAPNYEPVRALVQSCLDFESRSVSAFNANLLEAVARAIGLRSTMKFASDFGIDPSLRGEDRVLAVCAALGAREYVNSIGGVSLYSSENFDRRGVTLRFLKGEAVQYRQFGAEFVPSLSIIDALMFTDESELADMLSRCRKLTKEEAAQAA